MGVFLKLVLTHHWDWKYSIDPIKFLAPILQEKDLHTKIAVEPVNRNTQDPIEQRKLRSERGIFDRG